jgi:hypothetical protein
MKLSIIKKTIFFSTCLILFTINPIRSQILEITGTAKAGSYQMGTVKMVPAGTGFKSIRFENETEILAEFNASVDIEPPAFKIGKIKIGNVDILNPVGFPDHLFFNHGGASIFAINRTESSMLTDRFNVNGLLSVRQGIQIDQNVQPFSSWRIATAPTTGTLEFFLNETLKARINTSGTYSALSDRRLKASIEELYPTLPKVLRLRAKSYIFKDAPDAARSIGFIAQEVAELFPELVEGDPNGESTLSLDYSGFGVLAIKAIQEQQSIINSLEQRIETLEGMLEKP